ncbi:ABC transporter ATP-binding protein, partial [Candidatus Beckwithbacteria bacterium CG_4_9_14_0_2_um_filter_47_11]
GEKQKVCLAGVLARDPEVILLDEPTAMLDYQSSLDLYRQLLKLNSQGKTIITVEHNTSLLLHFTQKTLILDKGKMAAFGPTKTVLKNKTLINRLGLRPACAGRPV